MAVILSCLILGFVGGWVLRGDEGDVTVLAPTADAAAPPAGTTPDVPTGATGTGTTGTVPGATAGTVPGETAGTAPAGTAGTVAEPPDAIPARGDVAIAVLNGTSVAGLAASTAERAETLGYRDVETGNAPATTGPSVVYHQPGARPAAERAATDLEIVSVRALPRGGDIAETVPDAEVVVVLGGG